MNDTTALTTNGVDLDQLTGTIKAIQSDPTIAYFKFRATTAWVEGGHCTTRIKEFFGAKQEDSSRSKSFILEGDEPGVLLGKNLAPNAVEVLLHALSSCLTVGIIYNAAAMGINVESLQFNLEGDLDLHGFLGLSSEIRPGYKNITVHISLVADATPEQLRNLLDYVRTTSPVLDIITNPVPVTISMN